MALPDLRQILSMRRPRINAVPGSLRRPPAEAKPVQVRAISFGPDNILESETTSVPELVALRQKNPVLWIDVIGVRDPAFLGQLGDAFGLHPLALEDAQNVHQRPKLEEFAEHDFIVLRLAHAEPEFSTEQISFFLLDGLIITIQEKEGDCFGPVRKRIRQDRGRVRKLGADYLTYALIDAVIDGLFPVLESYGEVLEALEEELLIHPSREHLGRLHVLRRELLALRKATWPLRDTIGALHRDPSARWTEATHLFMRDAYDHAVQAIDVVETFREMASSLVDLYLSSVSNRMNDIMKVLTVITTVFVPLGFVAGLYGMNFNPEKAGNMPELNWPYGYVYALGLMGSIAGALLIYFWRKGWLKS